MLIHSDRFASHSSKRSSAGSLHNSSAAEAQTPSDVAVDNETEEYYMVYAKDRMNVTNMETTEAAIRQNCRPECRNRKTQNLQRCVDILARPFDSNTSRPRPKA